MLKVAKLAYQQNKQYVNTSNSVPFLIDPLVPPSIILFSVIDYIIRYYDIKSRTRLIRSFLIQLKSI